MRVISLAFLTFVATSFFGRVAFADIKWGMEAGVTTGYDDNITYVNTNRMSDMVTHTLLNGGFTQQGKNHVFDVKAGLVENIYTDHPSLDNLAENMGAKYTGDLNPYDHVKAGDIFTHSVDPSSLGNAFGRINGRYGTYYNNLGLEYAHDFTNQWSSTIKYAQTNYIFSTESLSDSTGYNPGVSLKYALSSQSQATANYDYRRRTFNPGGSSDANTPTVGWRQYLNAQWYMDVLSGVDFINGFGKDLIKPRYGAGLTNDVDQNTQLKLTFDKQYETDAFTQDISNDWHVTLDGFHQFTTKLNGSIAFFGGQGTYVISGTTYKFIGTNVTLKYALNERIDSTLTYGLQDSLSKSTIRASAHNTISAGITYKF